MKYAHGTRTAIILGVNFLSTTYVQSTDTTVCMIVDHPSAV